MYKRLISHAGGLLIHAIADQTAATREFLDCFHHALWSLKQTVGGLRFAEVTQALVQGTQGPALRDDALAFRLDSAVEHLLLDEFQDTSLPQWLVLEPTARRITAAPIQARQSFFCVGDVKQAIFGWRGGIAELFNTLQTWKLTERSLDVSRRSAQPIIDVVNQVFGKLAQVRAGDKNQSGLDAWGARFQTHTTVKKEEPGYVCLQTGPKQEDGQSTDDQRTKHCEYVADKVRQLVQQAPACSVGVLCRSNETVADMIYELRERKIKASEEGGNPLTDSPAVEVILSLFTLADHPGHSIAWFHLQNSPLQEYLREYKDADALAHNLRRELLADGYGRFTFHWAKLLASACDRRDLSRMQQLVDLAYDYQPRSTLRTDDFVALVQTKRVPDPSGANVRVMTIHGAKGLQFDVVVLPELDSGLFGQPYPLFVVRRDPKTLAVDFVSRYANESVQKLLTPDERCAFDQNRQQRVEESLSLLYVAMTRAVHAMYLYIPGPRKKDDADAWYNLLLATLAPDKKLNGKTVPEKAERLYDIGDRAWFQQVQGKPQQPDAPRLTEHITFCTIEAERRRGMEHVAPSRRKGQARVRLDRLLTPSEGTGTAAGTLYHAWFESIAWLDDGMPTEAALRATANRMRADLPAEIWNNLDECIARFGGWLQNPAIRAVFRQSAYEGPRRLGFPKALEPIWKETITPTRVERERRFLVREGDKFWTGSLDRVVWLGDDKGPVAADVLDFKTDHINAGNEEGLMERAEHYRPQLEAYRRVVARLAHLKEEHVAARLVFTTAGRIVDV
jgi:ATP-dependent exoDNAse (exonuclease V) beta subunit